MDKAQALELLNQKVESDFLKKHMIASGAVMRKLAEKFDGDPDTWELAGLLHDIDWEETQDKPEEHTKVSKVYLGEAGLDEEALKAIYVHNELHGIQPETMMEKALICSEELTGLIIAAALVRPEKNLEGMKVKSVKKKFKDKSFAAGVHRDVVLRCEEYIGMTLEELIELEIGAMQEISDELGL